MQDKKTNKIAVMQPYFFPYIGYFQLINAVDKFVIYDDVNYIKKGWINRNNIIVNGQKKLFTVSLSGASQNKLINEIEISDNFVKFRKTLEMNYLKAPYYFPVMEIIKKILSYENKNLSLFIRNSIQIILDYLDIDTDILLSSTINKDNTLKGQYKILEICKKLQATTYINPIGGVELYDKSYFKENSVELFFIESYSAEYKQFIDNFEPYLSILDIMMHNSVEEIKLMLDKYTLV